MVLARQPGLDDPMQDGAHDAAHRLLLQASRNLWSAPLPYLSLQSRVFQSTSESSLPSRQDRATQEINKVEGFCCPVPSGPRLTLLGVRASSSGYSRRITQREQPQHSCHWQLFCMTR